MKQGITLPTNWKDELAKEEMRERAIAADKDYQRILDEAFAIPLRTKAQYPMYLEGRLLHLIRGIAKVENTTVQEAIRGLLQDGVERKIKIVKRTAKKKG